MVNRNYHRLTVHLLNKERKNDFVNTLTFDDIPNENEARHVIRTLIQGDTESDAAMEARIVKAYYNGKKFVFSPTHQNSEHTRNGWIIK